MLDATEIGLVAAKVMEDLEQAADSGDLGDSPKVLAAMVIYEVRGDVDGDPTSVVGGRVTDNRNVLGLGLTARMTEALIRPDED